MTKKHIPEDLAFEADHVRFDFRSWIDADMVSTLGDLQALLQEVEDEMTCFDSEALIVDHWDELGVTSDYVSLWGDPSERDEDEDALTFEYRLGNLEEDLRYVEELIDGLGRTFKLSDLPMPQYAKSKVA